MDWSMVIGLCLALVLVMTYRQDRQEAFIIAADIDPANLGSNTDQCL